MYNKTAKERKTSRGVKVACQLKVDWNHFRMLFAIAKISIAYGYNFRGKNLLGAGGQWQEMRNRAGAGWSKQKPSWSTSIQPHQQ